MGMLFAVASVFVTVAAAAYYVGMGVVRSRAGRRVIAFQESREELFELGFDQRVVGPAFRALGRLVTRITPIGWGTRVGKRLQLAGIGDGIDVNTWAAIKGLSVIGAVLVWGLVQTQLSGGQSVIALLLLLFLGFFGPDGYLNRAIESRREAMRHQLPEILDLLVISVEAGLGFEAALSNVVETVPGEMSEEFRRMLQETRVGIGRSDSMRHLADRTDVEELDSFLLAMGQAETFGVSVSRVLRVQADEMRTKRRQRAQERAFAAPVKMVFPLVLCIFPAMFLVLLGPAAVEIFRAFVNR